MHFSKEVSTLENEMLELKESLAEWKSMPSLLHIDESASVAGNRTLYVLFVILNLLPRTPPERPLIDRRPTGAICEPDAESSLANRGLEQVRADDARAARYHGDRQRCRAQCCDV